MRIRTVWKVLLGLGALLWLGPVVPAKAPPNLDVVKAEVRAYVRSGEYDRDVAQVAAEATAWIRRRAATGGERLAVIFDLDETLLSNYPVMERLDFTYVPAEWTKWVASAKAPALKPMLDVYRAARARGFEVIFLSGRREQDRTGTEKNLRELGCTPYAALILKPDASKEMTGDFKLRERRRLQAAGYVIIANIGDQESDFAGGVGEKTFQLPNPFYRTE